MSEKLPNILYKYRDWKCRFHPRILENREIYFAAPQDFNDPFDSSLPFTYSEDNFTPERMFLIGRKFLKNEHPRTDESELHKLAYDAQSEDHKALLMDRDGRYEYGKTLTEEYANRFGILALSEKRDDILMWSHYSSKHNGFCVGFDSQKLAQYTKGFIIPIDYSIENKYPVWSPLEDLDTFMRKLIGTKSTHWRYEEEYRLCIPDVNYSREIHDRKKELPKSVFKEVIFGAKMPDKLKMEKIQWLQTNLPDVEIYQAVLDKESFQVNIELVVNSKLPIL